MSSLPGTSHDQNEMDFDLVRLTAGRVGQPMDNLKILNFNQDPARPIGQQIYFFDR
jgi:hypothetical protein